MIKPPPRSPKCYFKIKDTVFLVSISTCSSCNSVLVSPVKYSVPRSTRVCHSPAPKWTFPRNGSQIRPFQCHVGATQNSLAEVVNTVGLMVRMCRVTRRVGFIYTLNFGEELLKLLQAVKLVESRYHVNIVRPGNNVVIGYKAEGFWHFYMYKA
jgi:hypothetical protein